MRLGAVQQRQRSNLVSSWPGSAIWVFLMPSPAATSSSGSSICHLCLVTAFLEAAASFSLVWAQRGHEQPPPGTGRFSNGLGQTLPSQKVRVQSAPPTSPYKKEPHAPGDPSPVPRWALSLCLRWLRSPSKPGFYLNLLPCSIQQGVGQGQGRRCPVARLQGDRTKRPGPAGLCLG